MAQRMLERLQQRFSVMFLQAVDRWYRPEKTTVILVGDVDAEATFELVKKYWGGWERGDYDVEIPVEPPLGGPKYEHMQWEGPTQPWFVMAFRGPAYVPTEKDMPALDLISQIYFSESSDLYRQLVLEDQSVDQMFAWFPDRKDPGMLMIAARLTDASSATDVRDKINAALTEARTQLASESKVEETKSRLRYSFTAGMDSSGNIGSILATFAHFNRDIEIINDVYATYESLTAEDVPASRSSKSRADTQPGLLAAGRSQVRTLDAVGASAQFTPESRRSMVSSPLFREREENLAGLTKLYTREKSKKPPSWILFSEPDDRLSTQHSEN